MRAAVRSGGRDFIPERRIKDDRRTIKNGLHLNLIPLDAMVHIAGIHGDLGIGNCIIRVRTGKTGFHRPYIGRVIVDVDDRRVLAHPHQIDPCV